MHAIIVLDVLVFATYIGAEQTEQATSNKQVSENDQFSTKYYKEALQSPVESKKGRVNRIKMLSNAAERGQSEAQEQLGIAYLFGNDVEVNLKRAFDLFNAASATSASATSTLYLGFMYANGLGVNSSQYKGLVHYNLLSAYAEEGLIGRMMMAYRLLKGVNMVENCESALRIYSRIADEVASSFIKLTSTPVYHRIRLFEEQEGLPKLGMIIGDEVIQYYQLLAERGDVQAQIGLGELYYTGKRGTVTNFKRALYYFSKAAESGGSITAISYMGRIYAQGDARVPQDIGRGLRLLRHAAEKGDAQGESGLALMYYNGMGVKKDYDAALKYFSRAALQKNVEAFLWLGIMNFNGEGTKRNLGAAINYFTLATQGGHVLGPYYLAAINMEGPGILRNCEASSDLFKTVAERGSWSVGVMDAYNDHKSGRHNTAFLKFLLMAEMGYEDAQLNAAFLLDKGLVTLFDKEDCMRRTYVLYKRAADQGNSFARVRLGDFYFYGVAGTPVDFGAAVSQYKVAVDAHANPQAMFNLGYMYEMGLGLQKDLHLAKRFYDKALAASTDAILPASLALFRLRFKLFRYKLKQISPIRRSLTLVQEMQALRIGTMLSGLVIFLVFFWHRVL